MGEKKLPIFLNEQNLKSEFSLTWSKSTLKRRIESGFPAIRDDSGKFLFETEKVKQYFKRREVR